MCMLMYEAEELKDLESFIAATFYDKSTGEEKEANRQRELRWVKDRVVMWRRARFLDIYKGFIEGNMDLTGRHEPRWNEYMQGFEVFIRDFERLAPYIKEICVIGDSVYWRYEVLPQIREEYRDWRQRWEIGDKEEARIVGHSVKACKLWATNAAPKFQSLTLLDLPDEILELIFNGCKLRELLLLSRTCSGLRWARDHCLKGCEIRFGEPKEIDFRLDPALEPIPQISPYLGKAYRRCRKHIEYYLAQPKQCRALKDLSVDFTWTSKPLWLDELRTMDTALDCMIFKDLFADLCNVLTPNGVPNLTTLRLTHVFLDADGIAAICSLECLKRLLCHDCSVQRSGDLQRWLEGDHLPFLSQATLDLDLKFGSRDASSSSQWDILCLFPHVQNLTLGALDKHGEFDFPTLLYPKFHCIKTLQRLSVYNIRASTLSTLGAWLMERLFLMPGQTDQLIHFKIANRIHIPQRHLYTLFHSLHSNTLEALEIDGIEYQRALPGMIRRIALVCPNLRALKLVVRANGLQKTAKPVIWPEPSWAYAPAFSWFKRLQHFIWNYRIALDDATPFPLERFEREAAGNQRDGTMGQGEELDPSDELFFDDFELSAAPFVRYCPTLKSFASHDFNILCKIVGEDSDRRSYSRNEVFGRIFISRVEDSSEMDRLLADNPIYTQD
ncbi:hypothetical protein CC2G_008565 [Coprinopsis cinerea AmutBmut pab1-1]|nr:hypothetical protein CC2G_008565 [Coprinopsis cinerea AmutBmut pab1-1]